MNNQEKSKLATETMKDFLNQFGEPDQFLTILLEVLMEESFINTEAICSPDEPQESKSNDLISNPRNLQK